MSLSIVFVDFCLCAVQNRARTGDWPRCLIDRSRHYHLEENMTPLLLRTSLFSSTARQTSPSSRAYSSINCNTPFNICFVRHGQSTWNRDNRFIGWTDTPLTEDGVLEARVAGRMLQSSGILFDEAHTVSYLLRKNWCDIRSDNIWFHQIFPFTENGSLSYDDASALRTWFWWKWVR